MIIDFDLSLLMEEEEHIGPLASIRKKLSVKVRMEGRRGRGSMRGREGEGMRDS